MIIIKICGGLGNQLFQYAFGLYIENTLGISVKFYDSTKNNSKKYTDRELDILKIEKKISFADENDVNKLMYFKGSFLARIERKINQKTSIFNSKYKVQKNAHDLSIKILKNAYYDGYWQCSYYIDQVQTKLNNVLIPQDNFHINHQLLLESIISENSVSIHIRRDDYINIKANSLLYEICEMNYYKQAMELIESKIQNPQYYIFTQDLDWAFENFKGNEFSFITGNSGLDDMFLMSYCKHNIIANSTFSWWGAWLNKNKNKIVIAPKKWYKGIKNKETQNLIPENWIRL